MSFSENLKKVMVDRNISQSELSELTGVAKSGISQYLSGKCEPGQKIVNKLADALDCSAAYLTGEGVPNSKNVSIEQAARMLGKSKQFVRVALQKGIAPFGFAVKMSSKWTYHISPEKLNDYINNGC